MPPVPPKKPTHKKATPKTRPTKRGPRTPPLKIPVETEPSGRLTIPEAVAVNENFHPELHLLRPEQQRFLKCYIRTGNKKTALRACGLTGFANHYNWNKGPSANAILYRECYAIAHEVAMQGLEDEAMRRGVSGIKSFVVSGGRMVLGLDGKPLIRQEYSDALLQLLLRANFPQKYRENKTVEHKGKVGHTHDHEHEHRHIHGHVKIDLEKFEPEVRKVIEDLLGFSPEVRVQLLQIGWLPEKAKRALLCAMEVGQQSTPPTPPVADKEGEQSPPLPINVP